MSSIDSNVADFRSRAITASEAMRRGLSTGLSPEKSGISYCLPRRPDFSHLRGRIKSIAVGCAILGLLGWVTGLIACHAARQSTAQKPLLSAIAVCTFFGGSTAMLLPTLSERRIVRRYLSQHTGGITSGSQSEGIHIAVEEASTYGSLKILAEDVGLMYIHPDAHYVRIDGLSYEYVIRSQDVVELSLHANRKTVLISYMIGEERLDLAILPRSIRAELKRQTMGSSRTLFDAMQIALDVPNK